MEEKKPTEVHRVVKRVYQEDVGGHETTLYTRRPIIFEVQDNSGRIRQIQVKLDAEKSDKGELYLDITNVSSFGASIDIKPLAGNRVLIKAQ